MQSRRFGLAVLIPLLAVISVAAFAGGLGYIFTLLAEVAHVDVAGDESPIGVVGLGMAIVVFVPVIAAILERGTEKHD
ncbi:MAG: hypothetical protein FJ319_13170 [SAR202 cluster bacterium]|nr:hypothetical protein [SAR202 cluster bacterium]